MLHVHVLAASSCRCCTKHSSPCSTDTDMQYKLGHASWRCTWSIDMDMQHGQGDATWTWRCSMNKHMLFIHGRVHAARYSTHAACPCPFCLPTSVLRALVHSERPCSCCMSMSMSMLYVQVHDAWIWTAVWTCACIMDMGMQHGYGHVAWKWSDRMDIGMQQGHTVDIQHGQGSVAWTGPCSMDKDMQHEGWHAAWT